MSRPIRHAKRYRGITVQDDTPSDEEVEVDVSVTAGPSALRYDYRQHIAKRARIETEDETPMIPEPPPAPKSEEKPEEVKKRKQGASIMMQIFSMHFGPLHSSIFSRGYHRHIGQMCDCGRNLAKYRCHGTEKCFDSHLRCQTCILKDHISLPFHRIEEWIGTHFVQTSLHRLGYQLHLGHHGERCPNLSATCRARPMTMVHTNGFHTLAVQFCHCQTLSEATQLTDMELFPATMAQPETAFTFGLLCDYSTHSCSSKKSTYDYHDALVKMTNAAFPQDVPNRYTEFNRITRLWEHLAAVRRSGQGHGIDKYLPERRCGSLAVRCPACPEIGVNIDLETINKATEDESHKYTLFISADGNFRLQRKNKKDDPDDVALNGGNAYFVDVTPYENYLKHAGPCPDDCAVCAHLRATRLQHVIKFKNAVVSGVITIQCARHGFFLPQGMADLKKGEAFANTDYVLAHSLADQIRQRWIKASYDIWCNYGVNLKKRFTKYFPSMVGLIDRITGAIPKMHIKNHISKCQYLWAFNYIKGSGETYGEKIESAWGEGNQAAGSTKEMNDGHRHDKLDHYHSYYNWTKLHKLPSALFKSYGKCLDTLKTRTKTFDEFNSVMDPENVKKWGAMDDTPRLSPKGDLITVHAPNIKNGPPTQLKAYEKLIEKELARKDSGMDLNVSAQFIYQGLKHELEQDRLKKVAKETVQSEKDTLSKGRLKLRREILSWREIQFSTFPHLREHISLQNQSEAYTEDEDLLLPSSFTPRERSKFCLNDAAKIEFQLREGQAHDALERVRLAIKIFNFNLDFKKTNVHGQRPNTRAQAYLRQLSADKISAADEYRKARAALISLGLSNNDLSLQPLRDEDLWAKDTSRPAKLGDTRKEEPWFWTAGRPSGLSDAEVKDWSVELDRVKWFRDRSARDRAREEKEILEEEMKRTSRYFRHMEKTWISLAEEKESPGKTAYAYKQAAMYYRFASDCDAFITKAENACAVYREWFKAYTEGTISE